MCVLYFRYLAINMNENTFEKDCSYAINYLEEERHDKYQTKISEKENSINEISNIFISGNTCMFKKGDKVAEISVELNNNENDTISFYYGDDPEIVAEEFCDYHKIEKKLRGIFKSYLIEQIKEIFSKNNMKEKRISHMDDSIADISIEDEVPIRNPIHSSTNSYSQKEKEINFETNFLIPKKDQELIEENNDGILNPSNLYEIIEENNKDKSKSNNHLVQQNKSSFLKNNESKRNDANVNPSNYKKHNLEIVIPSQNKLKQSRITVNEPLKLQSAELNSSISLNSSTNQQVN